MEPTVLKVLGGWINVAAIRYAETTINPRSKEPALVLGVEGKAQPIVLHGEDAKLVAAYLDGRAWQLPAGESIDEDTVMVAEQ